MAYGAEMSGRPFFGMPLERTLRQRGAELRSMVRLVCVFKAVDMT